MPAFVKHIFTFLCAILLAHIFVAGFHSEDMVFDPMDTDDSAVIKQSSNLNSDYSGYNDLTIAHKSTTGFYAEQKTNKKGKDVKFIAFKFIANLSELNFAVRPGPLAVHNAARRQAYAYLFYKEINPPPPKCC